MQLYMPAGAVEWFSYASDVALGAAADMSAFLLLLILTVFIAFMFGRDKLLALTAALYAGTVLYVNFPFQEVLVGSFAAPVLYGIVVLCSYMAFIQLGLYSPVAVLGTVKTSIYAVTVAGLAMALAVHTPAIAAIYPFSPEALQIFQPPAYYFAWLVAPLVATFFFSK